MNEKYGNYGKNGYVIEGIYSETGNKGGAGHVGKVRLTLVQPEDRDLPSKDLLNFWRQETPEIHNALKVSFASQGGMSVSVSDMEVLVSGKNFDLCHQKNTLKFIDINIIEIFNFFLHNPRVFGIIFAL